MYAASGEAREEPIPNTSPSLPLTDYAGVYEHPAFGSVEVSVDNDKLKLKFQSGISSVLEHIHFDVFRGPTSEFWLPTINVRFHLSVDGTIDNLSIPLQEDVSDIIFSLVKEE